MTRILIILAIPTVLAIIVAGALWIVRHRAEQKYWREIDRRNGT